jgi:hypothetical protein
MDIDTPPPRAPARQPAPSRPPALARSNNPPPAAPQLVRQAHLCASFPAMGAPGSWSLTKGGSLRASLASSSGPCTLSTGGPVPITHRVMAGLKGQYRPSSLVSASP